MIFCKCGAPTIIRVSSTSANPGRRFFCCNKKGRSCGFVCWAELPLGQIPNTINDSEENEELTLNNSALQTLVGTLKSENKKLKTYLWMTSFVIIMYFIMF